MTTYKTNYSKEMVNLAIGMSQSIDELMDYCMEQFGVKDIFNLDPQTLTLLQKSMELTKTAQDYMVTTARVMKQLDLKLDTINNKMDQLLSR